MKPILFNTDMVRAILNGTKTVTRRVVKPQPVWSGCDMRWDWKDVGWWRDGWNPIETITWKNTPYRPGDILYVRETWAAWSRTMGTTPALYYKADGNAPDGIKWHPSIHMPREAARIFLRVTGVRVERLQDITDDGIVRDFGFCAEALKIMNAQQKNVACMALWDSTIKKADRARYGWDANPWVWVIEFERCEKPGGE